MQAGAQSLHPQHELVAHPTQESPGAVHAPLMVHGGAHVFDSQRQTFPPVQGSSASQRSGWSGAHAATQSAHAGQLDVAHALHALPGPQVVLQKSLASQALAQSPTPKRHTPPGQSS